DQLRQLQASGIIDVQCHTYSHSRVFTSPRLAGFVTSDYLSTPFLNRPQRSVTPLEFVTDRDLGAPLYPARSRMSDGRRVTFSTDVHLACVTHVANAGGASFFTRPGWRSELEAIANQTQHVVEDDRAQRAAIEAELDRGRQELNAKLATTTV